MMSDIDADVEDELIKNDSMTGDVKSNDNLKLNVKNKAQHSPHKHKAMDSKASKDLSDTMTMTSTAGITTMTATTTTATQ